MMDELMPPADVFVRSDTPDPRAMSASALPHLNIASAWPYTGTNNSGLKAAAASSSSSAQHTLSIPAEINWIPHSTYNHSLFGCGSAGSTYRQKRHWDSNDARFYKDDPPCKVHVNEEKVAQQFRSMSLNSSKTAANKLQKSQCVVSTGTPENSIQCSTTMDAMWQRFHELENKLHGNTSDTEVDEGVDMGGDSESLDQSDSPSVPTLHIIPSLQAEIANSNLPQILVPKPCKEVVLWQPSGVDHLIKETVRPLPGADGDDNFTPTTTTKSKRKVKIAARTMSPNSSLHLSVPSVRPNTPPPNSKAEPVSGDIPVYFVEDLNGDSNMDL